MEPTSRKIAEKGSYKAYIKRLETLILLEKS